MLSLHVTCVRTRRSLPGSAPRTRPCPHRYREGLLWVTSAQKLTYTQLPSVSRNSILYVCCCYYCHYYYCCGIVCSNGDSQKRDLPLGHCRPQHLAVTSSSDSLLMTSQRGVHRLAVSLSVQWRVLPFFFGGGGHAGIRLYATVIGLQTCRV
jgi:hypothetical protein